MYLQGREVKRQKSRLGINRISCGIRKESSSTPKTTVPLPTLPLTSAIMLNTAGLHSDSFSPVATAGAPATAVGSAPTFMPMLLNATSTDSKNAAAAAVAQRLPSLLHVGSNSIPQLDRIIGPGCRRAPHLAGTRVKIFCSQTNRLVKSSRSLTSSSKQDVDVRRVRRRLEAVNQMIWRCECADTAITKGAPVPPSALNAADAEKHLLPANPATTAARVASHLGIASSAQLQQHSRSCSPGLMPASEQLPAYSVPGAQLLHNQQPPEAAVASQLEQPAAPQPDDAVLIHQLPSTAPMLLDDNSAMLMLVDPSAADTGSVPCTSERRHGQGTHTGTDCDTLLNIDAVQHAIPHSRHPSPNLGPIPLSRSPSGSLLGLTASRPASPSRNLSPSGSLLGLGTSRQASPSSASLAELVPSTTAVTVPPYNVISAAKAGIALTAPVVAVDAPMPTSEAQDCWSGKNATLAVRVGLRGETSFGVPETPDHEKFVLNRERSSLSKDQAEALASAGYMHSDVSMDRKSDLLASGMMGLATSDALPGEIEPAMIELFLGQ